MAERKYWLTTGAYSSLDGSGLTNAGTMLQVTAVQQGTEDVTRIGDKVTGSSLEFRLINYTPETVATDGTFMLRVTIFVWKDDTIPTQLDLYGNTGFAGIFSVQPGLWPYNHDKKIKRKILFDRTIVSTNYIKNATTTTQNPGSGSANPYKFYQVVIPLTKIGSLNKIHYVTGVSTTGVNNIWVALTSNIGASANSWETAVIAKYNFIDM